MVEASGRYTLHLAGAFRLERPNGDRVLISSRRGQVLIAMLATASGGERTRAWLQSRLWGSRGEVQSRASLRRELSTLRQAVNAEGYELLCADHNRAWLNLSLVDIDIHDSASRPKGELLEGIDIPGEELFEDWLREERGQIEYGGYAVDAPANHTDPEFALRPTLAILPFKAAAEDQAIAEGISEDLIDRLSRLRWLPVIARSSSFAVAATAGDARHAGAALGARYVVEGTLRPDGLGHRLSASLVNAENGQTIWANRVPISGAEEAASLDLLITEIAAALGLSIDQAEQQRAIRKPQSDLNVSELIWKGRWHLNRLTRHDAAEAHICFEEALRREPGSPEAMIQSAMSLLFELWTQRADMEDIRRLRKMAQRAIVADMEDARGHMIAGIAEIWLRQPLRAEVLLNRAIEMNPSLYLAYAELGSALYLRDEPEKALIALEAALRLSPNDATLFYTYGEKAMAHLMLDQFDQAVEVADQAIMLRQAYWYGHVVKVNALARNGQNMAAQQAKAELVAAVPDFEPAFVDWLPFIDSRWHRFLIEGLNL
jgi:TolB-like protein